jgi:hypothetical protein
VSWAPLSILCVETKTNVSPQIRIQRVFKELEDTINEIFGERYPETEISSVLPHTLEDCPSMEKITEERFHDTLETITERMKATVMAEIDTLLASLDASISPRLEGEQLRQYGLLLDVLDESLLCQDSEKIYGSAMELKSALSSMLPTQSSIEGRAIRANSM